MKKNLSGKKSTKILMLIGMLLILSVAYYTASRAHKSSTEAILLREENSLYSWVMGTVASASLWADDIESQAKRISASELYRLFASDVSDLPENQQALLNNSEDLLNAEDIYLAEQIPLMRSILLDFMNMNGLLDIRIVDAQGLTLLSAQARPTPMDSYQETISVKSIENAEIVFSPVLPHSAGFMLHLADPLKPVLTSNETKPVASLLFTVPVTGTIAQFLARDPAGKIINPYIVQKNNGIYETVNINSPTPTKVEFDIVLDESNVLPFALRPSFGDPNNQVWSLGLSVPELDWLIVAEIPSEIISAELRTEAIKFYSLAFLVAGGILLGIALLWWIFIGREQKAVADHFMQLYQVITEQKCFLDNVNASLDNGLLVSTKKGKILLINKSLKKSFHCAKENIDGESITYIFEPEFTSAILQGIESVLDSQSAITKELKTEIEGETHLFRVSFYPFEKFDDTEILKKHSSDEPASLITITDITEFRKQSDIRRKIQEGTILAFISAVESMDPYLTGHSQRIKELGILLSNKMNLEPIEAETVSMAATLSQVGKLFMPRETLNKTTPLTEEERATLQTLPTLTWELLKNIDFNLPVAEALYQMYERLDGTGFPRNLSQEEISRPARILSVLNVFCAITAPRSYRKGKTPEEAIMELRSNKFAYDQNIVEMLDAVLKSPEAYYLHTTPNNT